MVGTRSLVGGRVTPGVGVTCKGRPFSPPQAAIRSIIKNQGSEILRRSRFCGKIDGVK
ncbi:MAG: hypothetical protein Fur0018_05300 [Anaerolineales bacterium]